MNRTNNHVLNFAIEMQKKLDKNEHKSGWSECTYEYLLNCLNREMRELAQAIEKRKGVVGECADIANFAMMIADNWDN